MSLTSQKYHAFFLPDFAGRSICPSFKYLTIWNLRPQSSSKNDDPSQFHVFRHLDKSNYRWQWGSVEDPFGRIVLEPMKQFRGVTSTISHRFHFHGSGCRSEGQTRMWRNLAESGSSNRNNNTPICVVLQIVTSLLFLRGLANKCEYLTLLQNCLASSFYLDSVGSAVGPYHGENCMRVGQGA